MVSNVEKFAVVSCAIGTMSSDFNMLVDSSSKIGRAKNSNRNAAGNAASR